MLKSFKLLPQSNGYWPFPVTEEEARGLRAKNVQATRVRDRRAERMIFVELFILCDSEPVDIPAATHLCFMHAVGLINLETYLNGRPRK